MIGVRRGRWVTPHPFLLQRGCHHVRNAVLHDEYSHRLAVGILRARSLAGARFPGVCFLILVGFAAVAAGTDEDRTGASLPVLGFGWWLAFLLQALPHTATGIQFIPLLPWCYSGWIPRIISAVAWLTFLIGVFAAFSPTRNIGKRLLRPFSSHSA